MKAHLQCRSVSQQRVYRNKKMSTSYVSALFNRETISIRQRRTRLPC